jgi:hypothetical protein
LQSRLLATHCIAIPCNLIGRRHESRLKGELPDGSLLVAMVEDLVSMCKNIIHIA